MSAALPVVPMSPSKMAFPSLSKQRNQPANPLAATLLSGVIGLAADLPFCGVVKAGFEKAIVDNNVPTAGDSGEVGFVPVLISILPVDSLLPPSISFTMAAQAAFRANTLKLLLIPKPLLDIM